ncbi:hypothetical protein M885DRAFT_611963 [Pelagophyceae sp. CCMP2097]|nr:hypothetical protein M885DRAFT_611963 [Pelagophyceae sp. CCMP2097]|mmetsp:Transcript_25562/g.87804  ORF Transcript_25562/g.87804 Transcript_25562/m.87804 type:complete len:1232 (-) Transcript_25562:43-3738(-)
MALSHRFIWGVNGVSVHGNLQYFDESSVVYSAGHTIVLCSTADKSQKFIAGSTESAGFSAVALCPSKRYVAVAEKADRASIVVYDLRTLRKRKVLSQPESACTRYASICFSQSNEQLVALTGDGAPAQLVCWRWSKGKVTAALPLAVSDNEPVRLEAAVVVAPVGGAAAAPAAPTTTSPYFETLFSPLQSIATALSPKMLYFVRVAEDSMQLLPSKTVAMDDDARFNCHAWLKHVDDFTVAGTSKGELVLFQSCKYLAHLGASLEESRGCTALAAVGQGFVVASSVASFHVYAACDNAGGPESFFECTHSYALPEVAPHAPPRDIVALAVRPAEDALCAISADGQLYTLSLQHAAAGAAAQREGGTAKAEQVLPLLALAHGPGAVTGLDVCIRKPLVVTCGLDRSVRVWNYLDHNCELVKHFSEDPFSVAFHPSGLHVIVGFSDKLRLLNLLMDDLRVYREVPIKLCRECCFSNGGQYFAAVNGNIIMIFDFYSCEKLQDLRGHNSKVRSVYWSTNDASIISCGQDGAVYQWDWADGKRTGEFVQKGTVYNCALGTADSVFAVGSDHMMKELEVPDLQPVKQLDGGITLGQIVLSHAEHMMFAGTAPDDGRPGCVRAYSFPLTGDFLEYACLGAPVTRMRISFDDQYLVVAGEDGCICVFDVKDRQDRTVRAAGTAAGVAGALDNRAAPWSEEILVTKSDLEEKNLATQELRNKIEELQLHNEYQLRLKDMSYSEKIKEATEKYMQDLEQEKNKYELLREEKNDIEMECEERHRQLEEQHHHELQELEGAYQQKIMLEVERYQLLVHERSLQLRRWEEQRDVVSATHDSYVAELTDDFEQKLEEDRLVRLQLEDETGELKREFDESKTQLEDDIDTEIQNLRHRYDMQLSAEREATLRYKGENGIMKKKFTVLTKDIEDQKEEIKALLGREKELKDSIAKLGVEIAAHKSEIRRRDDTIGAKEKKIYELKKKNQELEKFKFVLDYKIKELKRQIEPRETEISTMQSQIKAMDRELEQYHKSNAQLDLMIGELRGKLDAMQREILQQRQKISDGQANMRRFKAELHACAQHIQDPPLLKATVEALQKAHAAPGGARDATTDDDVMAEYRRHEDCLKVSLQGLQAQYEGDMGSHAAANMRVMTDNMGLICDITKQRDANKALKLKVQADEASVANALTRRAAKHGAKGAGDALRQRAGDLERYLDALTLRLAQAGVAVPPDFNAQDHDALFHP